MYSPDQHENINLFKAAESAGLLANAFNDIVWDWDITGKRIRYASNLNDSSSYQTIDYNSGYKLWTEYIHIEDRGRVLQNFEKTVNEGGDRWEEEYRLLQPDGSYSFILNRSIIYRNEFKKPLRMIGSIIKTGSRKIAQTTSIDNFNDYKIIAEQMPQLAWVANSKGEIIYANQKWSEYTGLNFKNPKSFSWAVIIHPEDYAAVRNVMRDSFSKGVEIKVEQRLKNSAGEFKWFLTKAIPIKDRSGKVQKWIGTCTDINDQKQLSELAQYDHRQLDGFIKELNNKNEQLHRANKDLDNFVYAASHDLRSPVRNIEALIHLLNEEVPADQKKDHYNYLHNLLLKSVHALKTTINDLTEVTRIEEGEAEYGESSFNDIFQDVKINLIDLINKFNAEISYNFEVDKIFFPRKNLRSILSNLVSNSIKYKSPSRDPHIEINTSRTENGYVLLTVKDNGMGIKKEDLEKVFTPFKRIHLEIEGTGIGLPIVKRIVDLNGGKIEVESEEDKGTCFKIFIKQ